MRAIKKEEWMMQTFRLFFIVCLSGFSNNIIASSPPSLHLSTDKKVYTQGEMIRLEVANNLDAPVWFIDYHQPDLVFWELETAKGESWLSVGFRLPVNEMGKASCRLLMHERPIGTVKDIKPNASLIYEWDQRVCIPKIVTESLEPELIKKGKYRFALHYSLNTVKSKNIENEPWQRPIDLGDKKQIHSNEFTVK